MLADNEKQKIKLEEEYRLEIRRQLQEKPEKKSGRSQFWAFLNSSFGLWLLSAVFITGIGAIYTRYQNAREQDSKKKELIERLDFEISFRYSQVLNQLYHLTDRNPKAPLLASNRSSEEVRKTVELLNQAPSGNSASLYPEFANMGIPALITELRRHLQDEDERQKVDVVLASLTGGVFENVDFSNVPQVAGIILDKLMIGRWKNSYFYFIDCPPSAPFC